MYRMRWFRSGRHKETRDPHFLQVFGDVAKLCHAVKLKLKSVPNLLANLLQAFGARYCAKFKAGSYPLAVFIAKEVNGEKGNHYWRPIVFEEADQTVSHVGPPG